MDIGAVIRTNRKKLGLTQEQMASRLGVTAPAVNKWEREFPIVKEITPKTHACLTSTSTNAESRRLNNSSHVYFLRNPHGGCLSYDFL